MRYNDGKFKNNASVTNFKIDVFGHKKGLWEERMSSYKENWKKHKAV